MTGSLTTESKKESAGIFDLPMGSFSTAFFLSRCGLLFGFVS